MEGLALEVPGSNTQFTGPEVGQFPTKFPAGQFTVGKFLTDLLPVIFYLATFLAFFWLVWGAFQWILAGGNKEAVAKAKSRITWAIVGLILILLAFAVAQWARDIMRPQQTTPLSGSWLVTTVYAAPVDIGQQYGFANVQTLGEGVNNLVRPAFSLAAAAVVFYFIIAAYKYLTSGGNKDELAKARDMIIHSIMGFIILMFTFLILQFLLFNLFGITGFQIIKQP